MATIKERVKNYYWGEDEFFDESFNSCIKTTSAKREMVEHTCDVEKDDLFGNIDSVIEYLKSLKLQGYVEIDERWSGYEDNYFVGVKNEEETDDEYYSRLGKIVSKYSMDIRKRKEEEARKNKRIKELEEELYKLKNNYGNNKKLHIAGTK